MPKAKPRTKDRAPRYAPPPPGVDALLDKAGVQGSLKISERTLWSLLAAGEFPPPDLLIGNLKRWRTSTVNRWIEERANGGRQPAG